MNLLQERDCGTGSGGFKKGNDCAGGGGSSSRNNKEPLKGLPQQKIDLGAKWGVITPAPHQKAREVAHDYMESAGLKYTPPTDYVKVDPIRATKIADEYESMKHDPQNPRVKKAYRAMADETLSQYNSIIKSGVKFEFIPTEGVDPYAVSPRMATEDVRQNNHLYVFPTSGGFGTAGDDVDDNPLLEDSGVKWGDKPVSYNDIFRAVHDYFGHIKEGNGFRADGEENAWRSHSAMYSDEARLAMTSETRGQNSWVNFGKHSKHNKSANQAETKYAVQKTGLMSDWTMKEGSGQERDNENDKRNTNKRSTTRRNEDQVRYECGRGNDNTSRIATTRRFPIGRSVGGIFGGLESQGSTTPRRSQRQSELATRRMNMDIETRSFRVPLEIRTEGNQQTIVGYASTFDQPYPVDMVTEIIDRSAFTRTLSEKPDVYALIGHDPSRILGRTKNGTLSLSIDERGLKCIITPVMTRDAEDTLKLIASGCIDAMSFGFKVVKQAFGYADGKTTRRITDLELHEVSCVAFPANENATLSLRAKELVQEFRDKGAEITDFETRLATVDMTEDTLFKVLREGNSILARVFGITSQKWWHDKNEADSIVAEHPKAKKIIERLQELYDEATSRIKNKRSIKAETTRGVKVSYTVFGTARGESKNTKLGVYPTDAKAQAMAKKFESNGYTDIIIVDYDDYSKGSKQVQQDAFDEAIGGRSAGAVEIREGVMDKLPQSIIYIKNEGGNIFAEKDDGDVIAVMTDAYDDEEEFYESQDIKDINDVQGFADYLDGLGLVEKGDVVWSAGKKYKVRSASSTELETREKMYQLFGYPKGQEEGTGSGAKELTPPTTLALAKKTKRLAESKGYHHLEIMSFEDDSHLTAKEKEDALTKMWGGRSSSSMKLLELRNRTASPLDTENRELSENVLLVTAGLGGLGLFLISKVVSGVLFYWYDCAYNKYGGGKGRERVSAKDAKSAIAEVERKNPDATNIVVEKVKRK